MSEQNQDFRQVKELAIPSQTKNTLASIMDPYHDYNLRATGYPDGKATISAIRRFYSQATITCPFVLAAGDSWAFHVYTTPVHETGYASAGNATAGGIIQMLDNSPASQLLGPVMVVYTHYSAAGTVLASLAQPVGNNNQTVGTSDSKVRTVSLGFEIHNTTAEMYKSGSLTSYRINEYFEDHFGYITRSPGSSTDIAYKVLASYPSSLSQAQMYPNTHTWEAAGGVYCVALPHPDNHFGIGSGSNFVIRNFDGVGGVLMRQHRAPATNEKFFTYSPLSNVGVISSKYTDNTQTFTIDYRQVLEYVPSPQDSHLLSFATTAPKCDRLFMKLYAEMYNSIPPGVPVGYNDAGEWFRRIVTIAKAALPAISMLLPPQAKIITNAVAPAVLSVIDKLAGSDEKPENTTKKARKRNKTARMLQAKRQ